MPIKAAFIWDDALAEHRLSETHPLKPARLRYTHQLLEAYGAFDTPRAALVKPRLATEEELGWYHTPDYIEIVKRLSVNPNLPEQVRFSFGPGDNPAYEGIYEAMALSTGASVVGAELVASGDFDAAHSISGGLHHAMPGHASGFCVFDDPVIAIKSLQKAGLKVAYVDVDCHHGDGVQHAFYDTDEVLTVSVHESGQFLFPGTGFVEETGTGKGDGYSVNLPLYPYTTDEVYRWAFQEVVPPLLEAFKPDVLVSQLGIDTHFRDPITHMALTVQGFGQAVAYFRDVAPKWLALGGGGYDLQAVARSWTHAFGIISEQDFPNEIPADYREEHQVETLFDEGDLPINDSIRGDARRYAEASVQKVHQLLFPKHGLR